MMVLAALGAQSDAGEPPVAVDPLLRTITELDAAAFDAFNRCDQPGQLEKHASYFAKDVEFYHDTGGATFTRKTMIANTRKYVCGNFGRELIPGSLSRAASARDSRIFRSCGACGTEAGRSLAC